MAFNWLTSTISSYVWSPNQSNDDNLVNKNDEPSIQSISDDNLDNIDNKSQSSKKDKKSKSSSSSNKKSISSISEPGLGGLSNLGNTCFFNAGIQALLSCSKFIEYITELSSKQTDDINNKLTPYQPSSSSSSISPYNNKTFAQLLLECHRGIITTPSQLFSMLCQFHPTEFNSFKQSDAHESFNKMMEILDNEQYSISTRIQSNKIIKGMFDFIDDDNDNDVDNDIDDQKQMMLLLNPIKNPFDGLLGQKIECLVCCTENSNRQTSFKCLTVSLIDDNINNLSNNQFINALTSLRLIDRIKSFEKKENIDGYRCQVCEIRGVLSYIKHTINEIQYNKQGNTNLIKLHVLEEQYNELNDKLNKLNPSLKYKNGFFNNSNSNNNNVIEATRKQRLKYRIDVTSSKSYRTRAFKSQFISRCPLILCIHLNRLQFGIKINNYVSFPTILPLLSVNDNDKHLNQLKFNDILSYNLYIFGSQYLLMSVIVHHGNDLGGHYTTYRRKINQNYANNNNNKLQWKSQQDIQLIDKYSEWLHISDQRVDKVTKEQVLRSQAYMLFYQKNQLSFSLK